MNRKDLIDYRFLKVRLKQYREKYEEKFNSIVNITSSVDGLPKAHNKPNYSLEEFIDNSNELIKLYNEEAKKEQEIFKQLEKMENEKYRTVLYLRYIVYPYEKNALELTATEMHYDYYEVCRINGEALNEFDKLDNLRKKTQDNTNINSVL